MSSAKKIEALNAALKKSEAALESQKEKCAELEGEVSAEKERVAAALKEAERLSEELRSEKELRAAAEEETKRCQKSAAKAGRDLVLSRMVQGDLEKELRVEIAELKANLATAGELQKTQLDTIETLEGKCGAAESKIRAVELLLETTTWWNDYVAVKDQRDALAATVERIKAASSSQPVTHETLISTGSTGKGTEAAVQKRSIAEESLDRAVVLTAALRAAIENPTEWLSRLKIGVSGLYSISGLELGDDGAALVAEFMDIHLQKHSVGRQLTSHCGSVPMLTSIQIAGCGIGEFGMCVLCRVLQRVPTLRLLDVSRNNCQTASVVQLLSSLMDPACTSGRLTCLRAAHTQIQNSGAKELATGACASQSLTELDLGHCPLGSDGIAVIGRVLRYSTCIQTLTLQDCAGGVAGCSAVAECMGDCTTLTRLDLSHNACGDEGAAALAKALSKHGTLISLGLASCGISKTGASHLAHVLPVAPHLQSIDLRNNYPDSIEEAKAAAGAYACVFMGN